MKYFKLLLFLCLVFLCAACNHERNRIMLIRLQQWDKISDDNPEALKDSLQQINPAGLSRFNKAYYGLLKTIADDKTFIPFSSDSLINETEKQLHRRHKGSELHIRSLIYQGIVRYRMGVTDSTAFVPLKEAERLYANLQPPNPQIGYLMYYYLGKILEKNDNATQATNYYQKALQMAEKEKKSSHIFDSMLALFWNQMRIRDYNNAGFCLDQLENLPVKSVDEQYYLLNAKSVYSNTQCKYLEALQINKKRIYLTPQLKEKPDIFRLYYSIADDYLSLSQLDSAMFYIEKSMEHIADSNYMLNHLIYEKAAEIAEMQNDYISANNYRKKLVDEKNKTVSIEKSTTILELEKKYNHVAVENKVIKEKAKNRSYFLIILLLSFLIVALISYLHQKKKRNLLKIAAIKSETRAETLKRKLFENETVKLQIENEKKELTNELYNQMLNQFFELENELREFADKSRLSNPDFADKIEELRNTMSKRIIESFSDKMTHKQFTSLTEIPIPDNITKSELLMLFLINCKLSNKEIAVILKTTPSSIRSRKHLLKNKMLEAGADPSAF